MADSSYNLPTLRRVVTNHNEAGLGAVQINQEQPTETMEAFPTARSTVLWVNTDSVPTKDNNSTYGSLSSVPLPLAHGNDREDGASRAIVDTSNFGLVQPNGTNLRCTDLAPGAVTAMHRTASVDYNILVSGEVILIMEDGTETHLKNPGDTVIQKGTMHAWKNPTDQWTRWLTVLIAAEPAFVNGKQLGPELLA